MLPVIREYLFPDFEHRPVSTFAVYLLTQMGPHLDPSIVGDLERVLELMPDSLEADMAAAVLTKLRESGG